MKGPRGGVRGIYVMESLERAVDSLQVRRGGWEVGLNCDRVEWQGPLLSKLSD